MKRLTTETAQDSGGSALSFACNHFGLELKAYMVRQVTTRNHTGAIHETWGGKCVPSPSPDTNAGRAHFKENMDHPGSLGIAISEATRMQ